MSSRAWTWVALLVWPLGLLPVQPPDLAAQSKGATLSGTVVDSAGRPLDGAEVELVGARRTTLTTSTGVFRFDEVRPTRYWLFVRRIGYYPFQTSLTLQGKEDREARIVMAARPFDLPEVVVTAQSKRYQARMREFLWRSRSSFTGRFLTRDDIARSAAIRLGDLVVRYMPFKSLWAMNQPGGFDDVFTRDEERFSIMRLATRRQYRPDCPPAVAVNGGNISAGWAVNDFEPDDVEAIEIYREGSNLPFDFSWGARTACGVVVVWLKSYAQPTPDQ